MPTIKPGTTVIAPLHGRGKVAWVTEHEVGVNFADMTWTGPKERLWELFEVVTTAKAAGGDDAHNA